MHADNRKHYREVTNIIETCHKPESDETRSTPPAALNSNERSSQPAVSAEVWPAPCGPGRGAAAVSPSVWGIWSSSAL